MKRGHVSPIGESASIAVAALAAAQVRAKVHLDYAMGMGPILLAQLLPDALWLPYDVITVPLIDGPV